MKKYKGWKDKQGQIIKGPACPTHKVKLIGNIKETVCFSSVGERKLRNCLDARKPIKMLQPFGNIYQHYKCITLFS